MRKQWARTYMVGVLAFWSIAAFAASPLVTPEAIRVRVLQQNIFGRPESHCPSRYATLGRDILAAAPEFDLVSLNEHWKPWVDPGLFTCKASILSRALFADERYRDGRGVVRNYQHYPKGGVFQANGGDSIFTTHAIVEFHSWKFHHTRRMPVSGFLLSRVELVPGVMLDVWTVHLESLVADGCSRRCRRSQLDDLARAIHRYSSSSGHPVLVLGDFNIGGPLSIGEAPPYHGNPGYEDIVSALRNPRDLWLEAHPAFDPRSEGYTIDPTENNVEHGHSRERIDYLFALESGYFKNSPYRIRVERIETVKWRTPGGTSISDHFGLDATLVIE